MDSHIIRTLRSYSSGCIRMHTCTFVIECVFQAHWYEYGCMMSTYLARRRRSCCHACPSSDNASGGSHADGRRRVDGKRHSYLRTANLACRHRLRTRGVHIHRSDPTLQQCSDISDIETYLESYKLMMHSWYCSSILVEIALLRIPGPQAVPCTLGTCDVTAHRQR